MLYGDFLRFGEVNLNRDGFLFVVYDETDLCFVFYWPLSCTNTFGQLFTNLVSPLVDVSNIKPITINW